MKAIVLAGGLGTRLRSVVADIPKPLAPIRQRPFLAYLLDYWIEQGVTSFVLSVGYKYEAIQQEFGESYKECPISYAIEKKPLGTGGAVLLALQQLKNEDIVLIMNGDTFFKINLAKYCDFYLNHQSDACIALHQSADTQRYTGVELNVDHRIVSFQQPDSVLVNGGVYLLRPEILVEHYPLNIELSFEKDILPDLINLYNITGYLESSLFIDIGLPEDYHKAQKLFFE